MTRANSIIEISERLATLTLSEEDLDFDFVVDQLKGLKLEIDTLEAALDGEESWLIEWLRAEHLKGGIIHARTKVNYKNELSGGRLPSSNAANRARLTAGFNSWSAEAGSRLARYEGSGRDKTTLES